MAWIETYHCDVCGKRKTEEATDWWLAWTEGSSPIAGGECQPVLKLTPWHLFLSHDAGAKHLCGGRCAQTLMDRWMHTQTGCVTD
ncbi:hypothetical protein [Silvibacterium dinghuense]|uniref:Uncharacterized protein n=1 Tax=Silvibacterium dinghuense TaxID=1560006 RepID=A0A4Q1SH91_9BACT|nr:hypothetical protein [Silvibacterium dinghuense]RXS96914.1 hypothetical protein ESZ00_02955 [Silvibacterium dinghuense]GGG94659.1 hypothetical protein GCM10011586_06970 [Silvibacterium dinghuense]